MPGNGLTKDHLTHAFIELLQDALSFENEACLMLQWLLVPQLDSQSSS